LTDGTLESFLEEHYKTLDLKNPITVNREYEAACLMRKAEKTREPAVFKLPGSPLIHVSGIITRKDEVYRLLSKNGSAEEAYRIITSFLGEAPYTVKIGNYYDYEETSDHMILPWIRYYEKDGGYYLTSSVLVSCSGSNCNASIHRIMLSDNGEIAVRLVPRHLYYMVEKARKTGERQPVTILMGLHPLHLIAAATSPPLGIYELSHSSRLLNTRLMKSPVHNHPIPEATLVAEAWIEPEDIEEGPFVDAMGTYDRVRMQPRLTIEKIFYKPGKPIQVILPGGVEHAIIMGFPREAMIYQSVSKVVPKVHKVTLTPSSGGWLHAVISITKNNDGDGKNAIMAAFAGHPSLKHVIIVDDDIDPEDPSQVDWAIATRFQADRDLVVIKNARGSTLDPSAENGLTAKMGIDATKPVSAGEIFERARIPGCRED
jgi:UbiD family decarboxylase